MKLEAKKSRIEKTVNVYDIICKLQTIIKDDFHYEVKKSRIEKNVNIYDIICKR